VQGRKSTFRKGKKGELLLLLLLLLVLVLVPLLLH
jgi:hypothetical protein